MLEDLLHLTGDAIPADDIFALIAADVLYAAPLAEPAIVKVFPSREAASSARSGGQNAPFSAVGLRCGSQITWDGRIWDVVNLGETAVSLLSGDQGLTELPIAAFETLIRENRLQVVGAEPGAAADSTARDRLSRASEADLQAATHRSRLISSYLSTGVLPASEVVPARTFFRWLRRYRNAEATCGSGFLGLLPQSGSRGNYGASANFGRPNGGSVKNKAPSERYTRSFGLFRRLPL
jgi:hypothetical protein